jgi:hypothetical protein
MDQAQGYSDFHIRYDGEGILDGQINARDLAGSLLALSTLLERSNKILNGKDSEIAVKVRANMQPGSFIINIVNIITKMADLGNSPMAVGWVNVAQLVGAGVAVSGAAYWAGKTLFRFLKESRGKNIAHTIPQPDKTVKAILEDGNEVNGLSYEVIDLYEDMQVRHAVESMFHILNSDSVTSMEFFGDNGDAEPLEMFSKEDLPALKAPESGVLLETDTEKILIISLASIVGDTTGWRFKEDVESHDFAADIVDDVFLEQVKARKISLRCGDMMRVMLHTEQSRPRRNLKTTHVVTRVIEYILYEDLNS